MLKEHKSKEATLHSGLSLREEAGMLETAALNTALYFERLGPSPQAAAAAASLCCWGQQNAAAGKGAVSLDELAHARQLVQVQAPTGTQPLQQRF